MLLIFTALLNFVLGVFIFFHGQEKRINKVYGWNIVAIISWVLAMFLFRSAPQKISLFWCIILYITPTFIASNFLYFTYIFPTQKIKNLSWRPWAIFLSNIYIVFLVAVPGILIQDVNVRSGLEKEIIFNLITYIFYAFYILTCFSLGFARLFQKYLKAVGRERVQIIYLLFGYAVAANLAFITNLIMPWLGNFSLNWLGQVFTVTMVGFITYAIVAHSLMDVKMALRRSFVYLGSLTSIFFVAVIIEYLVILFFGNLPDWLNFIVLIIGILIFPWLKERYYHIANKYFFSSLYDSQDVLSDLSDNLRSSLDTKIICNLVSKTLINAFHSKAVGVLIFNEKENKYFVECNRGFQIREQAKFSNDKLLQSEFARQNKIMIIDEIRNNSIYNKSKATIGLLDSLGVEILAPLNIKNEMIGLIALGIKESGDMYNSEDLRVLKVVGAQTAVALKNSLLYKESLLFSERLKKEVDKATYNLRIANQHLKELDRAKTEFVSITSHQLRTPLTGIKGYLSMFLEGDFGSLKPEQKKVITDIFNNSNRLVRLINIFLNVSRIESGRLKLQKSEFNLFNLVDEIVHELKIEADKKKIKLEIVKPENNLDISADRDKIADVILNLVDNAIKYTESGKIEIILTSDNGKVRVAVKDTGVGIDPRDGKELFNKFVRGRKIAQINTSGTGLGLFVAKKIIELHKGRIWVESYGQGKGSQFIFEIPVK